jgi:hypothetical protein
MVTYQDAKDIAKERVFRYKTPWKAWQISCIVFSVALMLTALIWAIVYSINLDSHPITYKINQTGTLKVQQGSLYLNNQLINSSSPDNTQMFIVGGFFAGVFLPPLYVYYKRTNNKERQKYYDDIINYWIEHKDLPEDKL